MSLKKHSSFTFFAKWTAAFVAGLLLLVYGSGYWPVLGMLIVAPTVIAVSLMAWGWLVVQVVRRLGGDPTDGWVGILVFISFACVLVPILIAYLDHRH